MYIDLIHSQSAKSIARQPRLLSLAAEALQQVTARGRDLTIEHDTGRDIGYDHVVTTTDDPAIFYARLVRDTIYTRFVKNGKPLSTQYLTLCLQVSEDKSTYSLQDIRIGRFSPPRPGSTNETADSKSYWANHALIFSDQPVQSSTLTKICPY